MKEHQKKDPNLPTSLNLTAETLEFLRKGLGLTGLICLYILRYLFFKKSRIEETSFLQLFGEDLSFSFGRTLLFILIVLSLILNSLNIGTFALPFFGSFLLINVYLFFFRFSFYLRWMAFFIFLTFFFSQAFNLNFYKSKEVSFEQEY